jgi:phosphomevalonate decarboxylase
MKATAVAHPIQGLIKYHGLKDSTLRIPFHDSISVCIQALQTITTVETNESFKKDFLTVNGANLTGRNRKRVEVVLQKLKDITGYSGHFKVVSENSLRKGHRLFCFRLRCPWRGHMHRLRLHCRLSNSL